MKKILLFTILAGFALFAAGQNITVNRLKVDTLKSRTTKWVTVGDSMRVMGILNLDTCLKIDNYRVLYQRQSTFNLFGGLNSGRYSVGLNNTGFGVSSFPSLTVGLSNTAIGASSMYSLLDGNYNVGVGQSALQNNAHGDGNTAIGRLAGYNQIGRYNIYIGAEAGYFINDSLDGRLVISSIGKASKKQDTTCSIIYGKQDADSSLQHLWLNANVHVGSLFGAYDCGTYTPGNSYLAASDGFVVAYGDALSSVIEGLTDGANPPVTIRAQVDHTAGAPAAAVGSIMFPVRKGDYWKVNGNTTSLCWLPLN